MSRLAQYVAVLEKDLAVDGLAQPRGAFEHGVEHGLDVRGGVGDHAQDVRSGRLLGQAVRQLLVALLQLREQAHVLDGDQRLVGEGLQERDLALAERPGFGAADRDGADGAAVAHHGHAEGRAESRRDRGLPSRMLRVRQDVGNVDDHAVTNRPGSGCGRGVGDAPRIDASESVELGRARAIRRLRLHPLALQARDEPDLGVAELDRALRDDGEDRLEIGGGAADHLEDITGGRLLLQRLRQLAVALLQLREQAHVLDGDDGLVRERLKQGDLGVSERRDLGAPELDGADRHSLAQERHAEKGAVAMFAGEASIRASATWTGRPSRIERPPRVSRLSGRVGRAVTGPWWAAKRRTSPSSRNTVASYA